MATITSSTGASGLAIDSIVSGLMTIEKQPLTNLQTKISAFNTKLSAFGSLKSGLSSFQTALDNLSSASKFTAQSTTLSEGASVTATANGNASNGSYNLSVSQLASSQKLATAAFSSTSATVGTGTLTFSFGTYQAGSGGSADSFTANSAKPDLSVTITNSNNTLAGVRDAINAQNGAVSASIVNDGSGFRLVVTSKDSGAANSLKITVNDGDGTATDSSGLSALAYDPLATTGNGKNMTQLVAAQNAQLTVDGLSISSASNTLTDAIEGVTLNLKAVTTNNTLTVSTDTSSIQNSVQSFVDAYNKLNTNLRNLTKFVGAGSTANGPLMSDAATREIAVKIKSILTQTSTTATTYKTLTDIGITPAQDGTLSINQTTLTKALTTQLSDVAKLFAPSATTTDPQVSFVSSTGNSQSGTYAINVTQLASGAQSVAGTLNGIAATGSGSQLLGATGSNSAGIKLSINGSSTGSRGSVTFSRGLASELSQAIGQWLDSDGLLTAKTDGIQSSIKGLNSKVDNINARLPMIEQRYRAQYAKLDSLLSSMQNTSSFISQQITALNKSSA